MISRRNILDLKSRRDLYQFISKNPGLHISELSKKTNIPRSTLMHHLKYLMKINLISDKADGGLKRFYTYHLVGTKDKELLGHLRKKVTFRIIMYLFFPGLCSNVELAKELKLRSSTIDYHIKKLLDAGIIKTVEGKDGKLFIAGIIRSAEEKESRFVSQQKRKQFVLKKPIGREIFYNFKNRDIADNIYRLLITHKDGMLDSSVIDAYSNFVTEWYNLHEYKRPKKLLNFDSTIDNIINILEEIMHFPFHF
jgi:DNA-binding MarR family transcriptional regulator